MKKDTRIGPQFTNSRQAASGKKMYFLTTVLKFIGKFQIASLQIYVCLCGHEHSLVKKICQKEGA